MIEYSDIRLLILFEYHLSRKPIISFSLYVDITFVHNFKFIKVTFLSTSKTFMFQVIICADFHFDEGEKDKKCFRSLYDL